METAFFSRFQESEALRKITDQIWKGFRGKRLLSGSTRQPNLTPTTRFPSSLVSLSNMDIVIKEASAKETTDVKQLNMLPEPVADTLPNGLRVPVFHLVIHTKPHSNIFPPHIQHCNLAMLLFSAFRCISIDILHDILM
ncbi:unnamed protein product [Brassica napus]|uniref:(rape) hypothetical protein n=1 Tax=Brassica napus TaxID=3708 RepID=A0A816KH79_BRANA|nr:unnamed protein product [Brassica napus]